MISSYGLLYQTDVKSSAQRIAFDTGEPTAAISALDSFARSVAKLVASRVLDFRSASDELALQAQDHVGSPVLVAFRTEFLSTWTT